MRLNRRRFLSLAAGGVAAASVGAVTSGCASDELHQTAKLLASGAPLPEPFTTPLAVPSVKRPISTKSGVARYEVVQKAAEAEILPGLKTPIMAYDGTFPGPTFETRRGQALIVNQRNTLDVPTVTHLHGGNTPSESDGYPIDLVMPEGNGHGRPSDHDHEGHAGHDLGGDVSMGHRNYHYPNDQPAATLWYHDHRMDFTAPQVWRGLAGFHLIRDDVEDALPLPGGERDLPLMIMDRAFEEDGSFRYPALDPTMMKTPGVEDAYMSGVMGDVILVNGTPWPVLEVEAVRYRLRLLNASNARRYTLSLNPAPGEGASFVQIGSDGGLLEAPRQQATITLAPAERFDVIVDFSRYPVGTEVTMTNTLGHGSTSQVMKFVVARNGKDESSIPQRLTTIEKLVPPKDAPVREWRFTRSKSGQVHGHDGWVINGRLFDPHRMDASAKLGDVEIWRFYTDLHHPVHVHLSPFQVLSRGNKGPGPMDAGWKDTIDLRPTEYADVAIKFTGHTGKYVMHCHNLEHEDMMMMAAFETVK